MLPDSAQPDIAWANDELRKRERLQKDILEEFNSRLADRGIEPISSSAFNRHSMQLAETNRRIEDTHRVVSALGERLNEKSSDDLTIMVGELGKVLVFELLQGAGQSGMTPKDAKELANAARAFAQAQSVSTNRLVKLEGQMEKQVEDVTEALVKSSGLTAERAAEIRREVLGVRK
jgi:hypothetical protein